MRKLRTVRTTGTVGALWRLTWEDTELPQMAVPCDLGLLAPCWGHSLGRCVDPGFTGRRFMAGRHMQRSDLSSLAAPLFGGQSCVSQETQLSPAVAAACPAPVACVAGSQDRVSPPLVVGLASLASSGSVPPEMRSSWMPVGAPSQQCL